MSRILKFIVLIETRIQKKNSFQSMLNLSISFYPINILKIWSTFPFLSHRFHRSCQYRRIKQGQFWDGPTIMAYDCTMAAVCYGCFLSPWHGPLQLWLLAGGTGPKQRLAQIAYEKDHATLAVWMLPTSVGGQESTDMWMWARLCHFDLRVCDILST